MKLVILGAAILGMSAWTPVVDAAPALPYGGSLTGKVVLKTKEAGKVPKQKKLRVDSDEACAAMHQDEPLLSEELVCKKVGEEVRIQWVFVYINSNDKGTAPADEKVIDQKGCHYEPHVLGVVVGQKVKIRNSDALMHNIHGMPQINKEFNFGQAKQGMEEVRTFDQVENAIKIKCDVHSWMSAYMFVRPNGWFAVSNADGAFEIKDVPPGEYEVVAWHEKWAEPLKQKVKIEEGKAAELNFEFAEQ